jgi:hypothetical protein
MQCMLCGEGHKSSKCSELRIPPQGFFTGGGGGGGHSHDDNDERGAISSAMPYKQDDLMDGEIQSKLQMQRVPFHKSPNKPSNVVVQEA